MPIHLRVNPGDIAKRVIIVGDPERAKQLSELLVDARLVNDNRGLITYTGKYNNVDITVATHGIGAPSAAIVIEELISMGARFIIRLGTTGALRREIGLGDVIVPTGSAYNYGGIYTQYLGGFVVYPAVPDYHLMSELIRSLETAGLKPWVGPVYSSDAFYAEEDLVNVLGSRGFLGVEMETAILFLLGLIRNVKAAAVLIVSNNLTEGRAGRFLTASELRDVVLKVGKAVLNALALVGK
ncbi:purine-nucleoside phosphorylase [Vulcanisaeta distributa]|uniref:Purine or other phosphorylase family 1 n=1 Tax=Vulcanisaeta distributa (strain DSM 14429 / JCM 11212 / NBRC 100878 / IC-017) TaxID=572478 RepID=E1QQK9_VULDI|nr:purine-nucleoside phosphorylase [Vulcanisaeta distributa]ADN50504.1 purine or other phosphorylase family 1 [Vulcanisaeta distributa DSM 14429]